MRNQVQTTSQTSRSRAPSDVEATARALYRAYQEKDLAAAQELVAENFSFTSPLDNQLDRAAYFKICWPNSAGNLKFTFKKFLILGQQAFVTYEATAYAKTFRNTEILNVEDGKVTSVEVYFGWDIPHEIAQGEHRDPEAHT